MYVCRLILLTACMSQTELTIGRLAYVVEAGDWAVVS